MHKPHRATGIPQACILVAACAAIIAAFAASRDDSPVHSSQAISPEMFSRVARIASTGEQSARGQALVVNAGETISGVIEDFAPGRISAIGVRIGNYFDSADGSLELTLCVNDACQTIATPLTGSKDNDFITFELRDAADLEPPGHLEYRIGRSENATNRVAIWAYPASGSQAGLIDVKGEETRLVPLFQLHYLQVGHSP